MRNQVLLAVLFVALSTPSFAQKAMPQAVPVTTVIAKEKPVAQAKDILGLYPLVVAEGASQLARRDVGTPVFGGMIFASFLGIFAIPPLYVTFQWIAEKLKRGPAKTPLIPAEKPKDAQAPEQFSPGPAE